VKQRAIYAQADKLNKITRVVNKKHLGRLIKLVIKVTRNCKTWSKTGNNIKVQEYTRGGNTKS